jgi:hypothetical protein
MLCITASVITWPFTNVSRVQYPIIPCFAMTVHKAQGQTLDCVGIYFAKPSWTHGLLYVAASRVRTANCCFIVSTDNVVHNCTLLDVVNSWNFVWRWRWGWRCNEKYNIMWGGGDHVPQRLNTDTRCNMFYNVMHRISLHSKLAFSARIGDSGCSQRK